MQKHNQHHEPTVKNMNVTEEGYVYPLSPYTFTREQSKATQKQRSKITTYSCILVAQTPAKFILKTKSNFMMLTVLQSIY